MKAAEYLSEIAGSKRANKYGAKRTIVDGYTFDSKAEADYYATLKLRARAGEVSDIRMQVKYPLVVSGLPICTYRADFVFFDITMQRHRVVDVKGVLTRVFRIKQKLMKACHGLDVELVK